MASPHSFKPRSLQWWTHSSHFYPGDVLSMRESLGTRIPMSTKLRFGLFEFDPAQKELRREGAVVRLQSQPAQVLACLLECAGEVVSREELRAAVWHDDT